MADGVRLFVPQSAPGDRLRVQVRERRGGGYAARPLELLSAGPDRAEPPCPHFGPCGGCLLQHLRDDPYSAWKRRLVVEALERRGLGNTPVEVPLATPPRSRRRATVAARRLKGGVVLGFMEYRSTRIVDLHGCMVLRPEIVALFPALRNVLAAMLRDEEAAEAAMTRLDDGVDIILGLPRPPDVEARQRLAAFADAQDLARLSWRPLGDRQAGIGGAIEPLAHRRPGVVAVAGLSVTVPPGGFLQASAEGEARLQQLVSEAVGAGGRPIRSRRAD